MIIAITGGTGFIGKRLVRRHMDAGDAVRVLTRKSREECNVPDGVEHFKGDLCAGAADLKSFVGGVDVLYHCAGELKDEQVMHELHVEGTRNLLALAKGRVGRWMQLSSVGVYGPKMEGVVDESAPLNPVGMYEITKGESDKMVLEAALREDIACTIIRPSIVFGEDMPNKSLYQLIGMINRGLFFFVGKPGASANYVHIDNVVEALFRAATSEAALNRAYNISDHRTIEEFVIIISRALGKSLPRIRVPAEAMRFFAKMLQKVPGWPLTESRVNALTTRAVYSIDAIAKDLSYQHVVSMEDGLESMICT